VAVESAPGKTYAAVDEAYRRKYARFGDTYVRQLTTPTIRATTLRLVPR
jgi:hypothetical protein